MHWCICVKCWCRSRASPLLLLVLQLLLQLLLLQLYFRQLTWEGSRWFLYSCYPWHETHTCGNKLKIPSKYKSSLKQWVHCKYTYITVWYFNWKQCFITIVNTSLYALHINKSVPFVFKIFLLSSNNTRDVSWRTYVMYAVHILRSTHMHTRALASTHKQCMQAPASTYRNTIIPYNAITTQWWRKNFLYLQKTFVYASNSE